MDAKFISAHSIPPFVNPETKVATVPENLPIVACRNFMNSLGEHARTLETCSNDMAYRDSLESFKLYRRLGEIFEGEDEKSKKIVEIYNEIAKSFKKKHKEIWQNFEAGVHALPTTFLYA